jgi:hypothetical protein
VRSPLRPRCVVGSLPERAHRLLLFARARHPPGAPRQQTCRSSRSYRACSGWDRPTLCGRVSVFKGQHDQVETPTSANDRKRTGDTDGTSLGLTPARGQGRRCNALTLRLVSEQSSDPPPAVGLSAEQADTVLIELLTSGSADVAAAAVSERSDYHIDGPGRPAGSPRILRRRDRRAAGRWPDRSPVARQPLRGSPVARSSDRPPISPLPRRPPVLCAGRPPTRRGSRRIRRRRAPRPRSGPATAGGTRERDAARPFP